VVLQQAWAYSHCSAVRFTLEMAASPERARRARKPSVKAALNDGLQQLVRMCGFCQHTSMALALQHHLPFYS
jgi:hypothetical protein